MKRFEQKLAKRAKATTAEYTAAAGFVLIRNPGIFAGGVDMSLLRGLRELLFKKFSFSINYSRTGCGNFGHGLPAVALAEAGTPWTKCPQHSLLPGLLCASVPPAAGGW